MPYLKGAWFRLESESEVALLVLERVMACACLDGPPPSPCLIRQTPLRLLGFCGVSGGRTYYFPIGHPIRPNSYVQFGMLTNQELKLDKQVAIHMRLDVEDGDVPPERSIELQ